MKTTRLEAFSDGVIAILITIMVLELKTPPEHDWAALVTMGPRFCPYVLSFVMLGIYWNNHHHMIHMTDRVTGGILWANLHLLFWLSLIPFGTAWIGETELAPLPTAVYAAILMLAGTAYYILKTAIIRSQGPHSPLQAALGSDVKGIVSVLMYLAAIPLAFVSGWIAAAIMVAVAFIWLVPDRRIEGRLREDARVPR
jgi:TMEM175 potassium channel family protein